MTTAYSTDLNEMPRTTISSNPSVNEISQQLIQCHPPSSTIIESLMPAIEHLLIVIGSLLMGGVTVRNQCFS